MKTLFYKNWDKIFLMISLIICAFLLFYKIENTFFFGVETGGDLLMIKEFVVENKVLLHGSVTSRTWLFFGPYHLWMLSPIMFLASFNPFAYALFARIIALLSVILIYFLSKKMFNKRVAVFSAFFLAISPLHMFTAYSGRHDYLAIILSILVVYLFYKIYSGENLNIALLGFITGVMVTNEYNSMIILPGLFLIFVIKKIKYSFQSIIKFFAGIVLAFFPLILFDTLNTREMLFKFVAWIPYRLFKLFQSFTYSDNSYDVWYTINNFKIFLSKSILPENSIVGIITGIVILMFGVYILIRKVNDKRSLNIKIAVIVFFTGMISLLIFSNPPIHYFNSILLFPILIFSYMLNRIWKISNIGKFAVLVIIFCILAINISYYFSNEWYFKNNKSSYYDQLSIAKKIIKDANGKEFEIGRIGLFDNFENQFADNYIFLLWYLGNEPVKNSSLKYIIVEDKSFSDEDIKGRILVEGETMIIKQNEN